MAAETRHAGLTADERSSIRSTVLKARETIENDLYRQLERYGVYDDERVDIDALGHLDAYDRQTRTQIDAALDRELEATDDDYERSVKNYVREATKTYLNRLVALKAIEVRGLVTETMIKRPEYGNRSEMHRTVDEVAGELTDQPDNGFGVILDLAFTELTDEIGVIFKESEHTAIDLDFTVREEIIEQLNAIDESVWESDEAMGWVYQYFGENEREEIDDRIDEENYKVQDTDVATKTQLFTPRYIVEWMVDNSLGRLWLEMYAEETEIDDEDNCFYLAPLEESLIDRDIKNVRDIKVLDPACGSGHMLFYAFDVLYEMYLEEGDIAEKYIPREILKHNLYGIDIDPGAAQLAALSLYLKAKSEEPDVKIEQINIVSADAVLINGEKKGKMVARAETDLEQRVLEQVWRSFENIREWGSLVRIEERIEEIIEEEREDIEELQAQGQARFTADGDMTTQSSFLSGGEEESWEQLKEQLLERVSRLAEEALEQNNPVEEMFAGEVEKSVRLLDLFLFEYDVVVTNPPYLGSRRMNSELKQFVKDNYTGSGDLYTAFIERCMDFSTERNYVSMITMETFMYLSSYSDMRQILLDKMDFIETAHLENRDEGYMNVCFSMKKSGKENYSNSRFNRILDMDDKQHGLNEVTKANRNGKYHENVYVINQKSFKQIGRTPFVYWFGDEILSLFADCAPLGELADIKKGLGTGGNDGKFVRKWWEVNNKLEERYQLYQKSGTDALYYDEPQDYILWESNGREIKNHPDSNIRSKEYYPIDGITYRGFGNYLVARINDSEMVYDQNTMFVVSERIPKFTLLGILPSSLNRFIMDGINPSMLRRVGDGKRLPIKYPLNDEEKIESLSKRGVQARQRTTSMLETTSDFNPHTFINNVKENELKITEELLDADVDIIHGILDEVVFDEYGISQDTRNRIYKNLPHNLVFYPHITNAGSIDTEEHEFREEIPTKELPEDEYEELIDEIDDLKDHDLREISEELEVSPYTVAMVRHEYDFYTRDEKREVAGRLLSYYLGCTMGRWELEDLVPSDNGIIVFDSNFEGNVMSYMRRCIELTYGKDELYEKETEIEEMLNKNIKDWLRNTFFRYHHCKKYRRRGQRIPIYWQLESDDGAFSCFVYYHSMDSNTFPKLRGQYIDEKLDILQNRLEAIESELDTVEGDRARELRSEREELQAEIGDISEFRDRVDALIDEGFEPDFEAGIWENIQKVDEYGLLSVPLEKL